MVDPVAERHRRVYGLLVTLCFSRYAFLAITLRQNLAAMLDGLESAWLFFGGVVKRLVEKNLNPIDCGGVNRVLAAGLLLRVVHP